MKKQFKLTFSAEEWKELEKIAHRLDYTLEQYVSELIRRALC